MRNSVCKHHVQVQSKIAVYATLKGFFASAFRSFRDTLIVMVDASRFCPLNLIFETAELQS